ncbi:DUF4349 domain-containing protein [Paenibacillus sp. VMFN-D1]|uniref:DUF4349 domain-containing protein n=1 Tax=Paenibacillus sp. VMFN-D1 TaxID=2135608 RepID=UPI000E262660|nr:DUF4349 domain-containing protein [Paenibacillus sp. VMFN-D1]RED36893.1 uncharacterized protein DUF4349 [Paenibacillus sp. VMFN-D1]
MRTWGSWLAAFMFVILLVTGCSSGSSKDSASSAGGTVESSAVSDHAANTAADQDQQASTSTASTADEKSSQAAESAQQSGAVKASEADTAPEAGFTAQDLAGGLNKKLIYKAHLVMEIQDYAKAQTEVRNMVTLSGGYIVNFSETDSASERGGTFILKVPASGFSSFLNRLEQIKHDSLQRSIEGQDVSEEYVDLQARLKAKQVMEEQYIAFMKKATKTSDLVAFAKELERVQEEIEQIKGRMRYIDQNVAYSTVELRIYQPEKTLPKAEPDRQQAPLGKRAGDALQGSMDVLTQIVQWIIVILSGAVPVLILAAIVLLIVWMVRKGRKQQRAEAAERRKTWKEERHRPAGPIDGPIEQQQEESDLTRAERSEQALKQPDPDSDPDSDPHK